MKRLVYEIEGYTDQYNPDTNEVDKIPTLAKVVVSNFTKEDIARATEIAYNGEYTIEDDGIEESKEPTQEQRIAELEAALEMLLSGVTE